jgi:fibronectin type 3 domain-containing protein
MAMTAVAEKIEQRIPILTAQQIEEILLKASHRQVGVIFTVKRVGNNQTFTFSKAENHEVDVWMKGGELMTVKMFYRYLRPFNQEHQTNFLAWLVFAQAQQANPGGIYGQPNCLFEKP